MSVNCCLPKAENVRNLQKVVSALALRQDNARFRGQLNKCSLDLVDLPSALAPLPKDPGRQASPTEWHAVQPVPTTLLMASSSHVAPFVELQPDACDHREYA